MASQHLSTAVAIMAVGVVYGTDVFCALVQRAALARLPDDMLTAVTGFIHFYGDRRLRIPGAVGLLATVATLVLAVLTDAGVRAVVAAAVATAALLIWFTVYARVSKPVNTALTAAARSGTALPEARVLQRRWDSVIDLRAALQAVAMLSLFLGVTVS